MRLFARNKQSWLSIVCIPQSINAALLCACFWVSLGSLAVREANAQGSVVLIIRILAVGGPSQTIHIWGPSATDPGLSLIGLGSNDNPSGPSSPRSGNAMINSWANNTTLATHNGSASRCGMWLNIKASGSGCWLGVLGLTG